MSPNLLLFRANKDIVDPIYLFLLMTSTSGQKLLESYITRTAKKTITAEDIKQIKIPIPSRTVQESFVCIAQKVEHLQNQQREAIRQVDHLFQTLLHEAFEGELSSDCGEILMADEEVIKQKMPISVDEVETLGRDTYQMTFPFE